MLLRFLRQHRPPEPGTSGHPDLRRGGAALVLLAVLSLALFGACDGDDDSGGSTPGSSPSAASSSNSGAKASDLVPDLKSLGYAVVQSGKAQGSTVDQDAYTAIFANPSGKVVSVRTDINVHPSVEKATAQYGPISEALRNPPPDLFGPNATQVDNTSIFNADQGKSYKTAKPDGQGLSVFTDAYRMGRAVIIVYVIGPAGTEADNVRKQVAQAISAKAPR